MSCAIVTQRGENDGNGLIDARRRRAVGGFNPDADRLPPVFGGAMVPFAGRGAGAERVGKVCRHILVPPMEALLDLARAAEDYSNTKMKALEQAA